MQKHTHNFLLKLVFGYFILGLVPFILLTSLVIKITGDYLQDSLINNVTQSTLYMSRNLSDLFAEYDMLSKNIYEYRTSDGHYLHSVLTDRQMHSPELKANINHMLSEILYKSNYIDRVSFLVSGGEAYTVSRSYAAALPDVALSDAQTKENLTDTDSLHVYFRENKGQKILTLVRSYMNTATVSQASEEVLGTLLIDVDFRQLEALLTPLVDTTIQQYHLADKDFNTVYTTADSSNPVDPGKYLKTVSQWESSGVEKYRGDYLVYRQIPIAQWILFTTVPYEAASPMRVLANGQIILIVIISPVLLFFVYWLYSRKIVTPVKDITDAMKRIEHGELDIELTCSSNDEFSLIASTLNLMTKNLKSYIDQAYIYKIKQKEAELDALKMQIRPHYLYNTLEIIRMTALDAEDRKAADMIAHLSSQLQYLTERQAQIVPLSQELENAKDYFSLVTLRYEQKYVLETDIGRTLLQARVPKLIIQPLIENAVLHAFPGRDYGTISIHAKEKNGILTIEIMDDGIGIPKDTELRLNKAFDTAFDTDSSEELPAASSIGLVNVASRLRLRYGNDTGLKITGIPEIGTIVLLHLPLDKGTA
ncbi:histidine kinase [Blautia schinkii]|nr:histidine kinase [Blautia schinkii]